jgi:hypothetical protein
MLPVIQAIGVVTRAQGISPKQLTTERRYFFFFFDLHMVVGHMPLRTLQGEKSPIILRS